MLPYRNCLHKWETFKKTEVINTINAADRLPQEELSPNMKQKEPAAAEHVP